MHESSSSFSVTPSGHSRSLLAREPLSRNNHDKPGFSGDSQIDVSEEESQISHDIPVTLLNKLKTFSLFKDAPESFHSKVAAKLSLIQYHPQAYIIKEGDPALSMFWILKGTVRVTSTDGESVYAELHPGSYFGEIGILFNRPRTATVFACSKVLAGVLTADSLNSVLRSYPLIERRIRDEAQERLAMHEKKNKAEIPIIKVSKTPASKGSDYLNRQSLSSVLPMSSSPSPLSQLVYTPKEQQPDSNVPLSASDNVDHTSSIQEELTSIAAFKGLPPQIIHSLALGSEPVKVKPFEYIFQKGDYGSDIYLVTHGELEVVDNSSGDGTHHETVLARLKRGAYFGEMSFLNSRTGDAQTTRSASIRSITSSELLVIKNTLLQSVCLQYPSIVEELRKVANERSTSNDISSEGPTDSRLISSSSAAPIDERVSSTSTTELRSDFSVVSPISSTPSSIVSHNMFSSTSAFVNPNWNFDDSGVSSKLRSIESRAVSPISHLESDTPISVSTEPQQIDSNTIESRKRKIMSDWSDQQLPKGPLDIFAPPKNEPASRHAYSSASRKNSLHYMPHGKRLRLSYLAGRRRSSALVTAGTIPDRILLQVFEYLTLPELMKLRLVSRRWRQLLYVSPNLFKRLDLTPWNTLINDQALINIADFVGSRPTYVDISNCFHVTDEGFCYFVNEVGMAGHITVLKMRSVWDVSAMAIMDLTSPHVGKYLEEVDLSNCRNVKDNVVERLIGWQHSPDGRAPHHPDSEGVFNNEAGSKYLKCLRLGYCKSLTDNIMYHISLHASDRLEVLDLTRCTTITDVGFKHWNYKSFLKLRELSIRDCTFLSDESIISIAHVAPYLEKLNLGFCCALSDFAIEVICLGCRQLKSLDLSFCGSAVSDTTLTLMALHLFNLEQLIVKCCVRVTRAGVDALLSGFAPLRLLDISQCRNAHMYPGGVAAQKLEVNPTTKSAFISAGPSRQITEVIL